MQTQEAHQNAYVEAFNEANAVSITQANFTSNSQANSQTNSQANSPTNSQTASANYHHNKHDYHHSASTNYHHSKHDYHHSASANYHHSHNKHDYHHSASANYHHSHSKHDYHHSASTNYHHSKHDYHHSASANITTTTTSTTTTSCDDFKPFPVATDNKCGSVFQGGSECQLQCCAAQKSGCFSDCPGAPLDQNGCRLKCLTDRGCDFDTSGVTCNDLERFPVLLGNKCGTPGQGGEKCEKQCCAAQEEFCENRPACNDACEAQCLIDRGC